MKLNELSIIDFINREKRTQMDTLSLSSAHETKVEFLGDSYST